jgi:hypothetical protein
VVWTTTIIISSLDDEHLAFQNAAFPPSPKGSVRESATLLSARIVPKHRIIAWCTKNTARCLAKKPQALRQTSVGRVSSPALDDARAVM